MSGEIEKQFSSAFKIKKTRCESQKNETLPGASKKTKHHNYWIIELLYLLEPGSFVYFVLILRFSKKLLIAEWNPHKVPRSINTNSLYS